MFQYQVWRFPSQWSHRKVIIVTAAVFLKLLCKVLKGIETMCGIEPLIILPVATLYFPVVPGHVWPDQLVPDAVPFQMHIKKCGLIHVAGKTVGKRWPVACLDTFDGRWERFHQMLHEHGGGIHTVLLKCLHEPPLGVFVNSGILEKCLPMPLLLTRQAEGTNFTSTWMRCLG